MELIAEELRISSLVGMATINNLFAARFLCGFCVETWLEQPLPAGCVLFKLLGD